MSNAAIGWILILIAGCLEVFWPIGMKYSEGLSRTGWVAAMIVALCASFGLLTLAVSRRYGLPIGTAYAVWTGMGAAGAGVLGILLFNESSNFWRVFFLAMIIVGIVGLKYTHREVDPASSHAAKAVVEQAEEAG